MAETKERCWVQAFGWGNGTERSLPTPGLAFPMPAFAVWEGKMFWILATEPREVGHLISMMILECQLSVLFSLMAVIRNHSLISWEVGASMRLTGVWGSVSLIKTSLLVPSENWKGRASWWNLGRPQSSWITFVNSLIALWFCFFSANFYYTAST